MIYIENIASKLGLSKNDLELYGKDKAKLNYDYEKSNNKEGKLILITSTNPTPYGEGKTTLSIGISDSLNKLGKKSVATLREPSLGPVFGIKGGACGGGLSKIEPELDINLHFTGDFHAITSANNLLCSIIDNHIFHGNELKIDKVVFNRCIDINDRALRTINLNNREEHFNITPASEIMAILCLSKNIDDLKNRINKIIIGYTKDLKEIYVSDLKCADALTILLKDAIKPNLVRSLYNNPVIVHGGPFANIAHGCSSLISTKMALKLSDYVITEAGFGSDMGALKFLDIKSRIGNLNPTAIIINTTIKSLIYNGNNDLNKGISNLEFHINNMKKFNDNVIVSLNKFDTDSPEEIEFIRQFCLNNDTKFFISTMYRDGEDGCLDLANYLLNLENNKKYEIYRLDEPLKNKIESVCKLLGSNEVIYEQKAKEKLNRINYNYPICIAKTPYSITDDKNKLGYPKEFKMTVTDIKVFNGAGFIVIYMGNVLTMPGLSKNSNYLNMNINDITSK